MDKPDQGAENFKSVPASEIFDQEIYKANLARIKSRGWSVYDQLARMELPGDVVRVFTGRTGAPGLIYDGRHLSSRYAPDREAMQVAQAALEPEYATVVGFGLGLGMHLPKILEAKFVNRVVVFEPRIEILMVALGIVDMTKVFKDPRFSLHVDTSEIFFTTSYGLRLMPAIADADLPGYKTAFKQEKDKLVERIRTLVRNSDIVVSTALQREKTWFKHIFENLPVYIDLPTVGKLRDRLTGIPAVLVAAGPSLEKNIAHLEKVKGKALIITVGTALKKILSQGVTPDMAMALESNDIMYQFEGAGEMADCFLSLSLHCFPKLYDLPFAGKFLFTGSHSENVFVVNALDKNDALIPVGGSVATACFTLAAIAGCDPIIMIGQDLAYGEKGESHASGIGDSWNNPLNKGGKTELPRNAKEASDLQFLPVEGYNGGEVMTRSNLLNYLLWYEANIPTLTRAGRTVINATQGGAKIHGAVQMPFTEAIETYITDLRPVFETMRQAFNVGGKKSEAPFRRMKQYLQSAKELKRLCKKQIEQIEATFEMLRTTVPDESKVNEAIHKVDRTEKKVKVVVKKIDPLITGLANKETLISTKCFDYEGLDEIEALRMNMKQSNVMYQGLLEGAETVVETLTKTVDWMTNHWVVKKH